MATTGQTINDRLNAVRYALVGQGLARTVCKATTEEVLGPKKKHIDYLLACTNEPNVSIPQLANLLIERTQHTSWAVVFKALISIHHLMSYGNERFTQYLATSNHSFELADFMDRTTPQGYNMSTFVRRYAKYINDKSISYRTLAIDLCKIRSGNDNALRTMNMDNLSKTLPIVQQQFDSLLDFAATSKDLNNSVIMSAFRLLYKDVVRLYVAYQEAIINLLERYFKLSRKKTREALEMYKKFLTRMDKVASFFQVADAVGLDKSEMPDLTKSPASILNLLEQHLARLEAKKRGTTPQGEDEELDNKENSEHSSASATQQTKEVEQTNDSSEEKKEEHSDDETSSKPVKSKEEPLQANKNIPSAQKPPRPSPKASPLVSPSDSKSPPGSTAKQVSPSSNVPATAAAAAAAVPEKRGPPERPAKPPSRPPPPSAAPAPPPPPPPPQQSGGPSGSSGAAPSTKVASHASPPPHPPPPQAHHQPPPHPPAPHAPLHPPAPSTSPVPPPTATATEANSNNTTSNSNSTNNNSNSNNNSADGNKNVSDHTRVSTEGPTCSASLVAQNDSSVEQPAQQQDNEVVNFENSSSISNEVETNHINNVSQEVNVEAAAVAALPLPAEDELEMPPPPPPIDDMDDSMPEPPPPVEAEGDQAPAEEQPQQQADIGQQQSALNGQPTNGAE